MWEDKVQRQQNPQHKTFISIQLGEIFKNLKYDDSFLLENEKGKVSFRGGCFLKRREKKAVPSSPYKCGSSIFTEYLHQVYSIRLRQSVPMMR